MKRFFEKVFGFFRSEAFRLRLLDRKLKKIRALDRNDSVIFAKAICIHANVDDAAAIEAIAGNLRGNRLDLLPPRPDKGAALRDYVAWVYFETKNNKRGVFENRFVCTPCPSDLAIPLERMPSAVLDAIKKRLQDEGV